MKTNELDLNQHPERLHLHSYAEWENNIIKHQ